jgi:CheY-like chemotaxis protein
LKGCVWVVKIRKKTYRRNLFEHKIALPLRKDYMQCGQISNKFDTLVPQIPQNAAMKPTEKTAKNIFLTDDDDDDCLLFSEALHEIFAPDEATLTIANDGVKLMQALDTNALANPEIIFLDLNMPRKNGFECLDEIRKDPKLKDIPVVIYSTTSNTDVVNRTYQQGANYYICKPQSFIVLKRTIELVLSFDFYKLRQQPVRDHFVINIA